MVKHSHHHHGGLLSALTRAVSLNHRDHSSPSSSRPGTPRGRRRRRGFRQDQDEDQGIDAEEEEEGAPVEEGQEEEEGEKSEVRPFLKVRCCTFNFHDNVPLGDLEPWLGVPSVHNSTAPEQQQQQQQERSRADSTATSRGGGGGGGAASTATSFVSSPRAGSPSSSPAAATAAAGPSIRPPTSQQHSHSSKLPQFPLDSSHPFHILVIAGQECPSATGFVSSGRIPMGMGFATDPQNKSRAKGWTEVLEGHLGAFEDDTSEEEDGDEGSTSGSSSGSAEFGSDTDSSSEEEGEEEHHQLGSPKSPSSLSSPEMRPLQSDSTSFSSSQHHHHHHHHNNNNKQKHHKHHHRLSVTSQSSSKRNKSAASSSLHGRSGPGEKEKEKEREKEKEEQKKRKSVSSQTAAQTQIQGKGKAASLAAPPSIAGEQEGEMLLLAAPAHAAGSASASASAAGNVAEKERERESERRKGGRRRERRERKKRGNYVLIEKERLMGIYLAVFVHRSCLKFVQGSSSSRVTAGLLNGRVGNKGGCGISLKFANSRLLFVGSHLAAHESGLAIRRLNVLKIKEELGVDDFEGGKGRERDLTDRFDQVFWMGDLNYRLSISRLHADWLFKTKDYHNALAFDQLRQILAEPNGGYWQGFREAEIEHPPTYKYDLIAIPRGAVGGGQQAGVGQGVKRKKSQGTLDKRASTQSNATTVGTSRTSPMSPQSPLFNSNNSPLSPALATSTLDVPSPVLEAPEPQPQPQPQEYKRISTLSDPEVMAQRRVGGGGAAGAMDDDAASIRSALSDYAPAHLPSHGGGKGGKDYAAAGLPSPGLKGNETSMAAVRRAQVRFMTLVRSASTMNVPSRASLKDAGAGEGGAPIRRLHDKSFERVAAEMSKVYARSNDGGGGGGGGKKPVRPILRSAQSDLVVPLARHPTDLQDLDCSDPAKARECEDVFDTSSKQRVQSYTDRILFKSNVGYGLQPPEPKKDKLAMKSPTGSFMDPFKPRPRSRLTLTPVSSRATTKVDSPLANGNGHWDGSSVNGDGGARFGKLGEFKRRLSRQLTRTPGPDGHRAGSPGQGGSRETSRANSPVAAWSRRGSGGSGGGHSHAGAFTEEPAGVEGDGLGLVRTATPSRMAVAFTPGSPSSAFSDLSAGKGSEKSRQRQERRRAQSNVEKVAFHESSTDRPRRPMLTKQSDSEPLDVLRTTALHPTKSLPVFSGSATAAAGRDEPSSSGFSLPGFLNFGRASASTASTTTRRASTMTSATTSAGASQGRLRSFFNMLPPFLSRGSIDEGAHRGLTPAEVALLREETRTGPKKGAIEPIEYNSVTDIVRMGAVSDHRPVYGVYAIGLGD